MSWPESLRIRIGGATKLELLEQLAQRGVLLNEYARVLLADVDFATTIEPYDERLAIVSLHDLDLPNGGLYEEILSRAQGLGLEPCRLEVAPHLRLSYVDQPEGPYLTVASVKPRPDPALPNGFYLRRLDGQLWLRGYESGPENVYAADFTEFAFLDRR